MRKRFCIIPAVALLLLLAGCGSQAGSPEAGIQPGYIGSSVGWMQLKGEMYYFGPDFAPVTGMTEIDGQTYFFDPQGKMITGWHTHEGDTYYLHEDGTIHTGPLELEGSTYLLDENGHMYTGWYTEGGRRYYYQDNGAMAVGKVLIDGQACYFTPHGEHVYLVNPWNPLPADYTTELVIVEHFPVTAECAAALSQMLADCRAAGFDPAICSTYRTYEDQVYLYENKVKRVMAQGYDEETAKILAAQEVAVPGTSEHHLGLAIDLVDDNHWVLEESQAQQPTQKWLMEHCWEYGFILRYPVGSTEVTGIVYEPWHYRYVGVEMALELRDLGITLEEYLGATDHT